MKNAIALLLLLATNAGAAPYFRPLDINKIHRSYGAYIDPFDTGNTSAGFATAFVTHSIRDGCLFPTIICEDWSPLAAGFSANSGRLTFNVGPSVNMNPLVKGGLFLLLNQITREDSLSGLKSALSSEPVDGGHLSMAFGPAVNWNPVQDGRFIAPDKWQGKFRVFAGAAWSF